MDMRALTDKYRTFKDAIQCRYGTIADSGDGVLTATATRSGSAWKRLLVAPCVLFAELAGDQIKADFKTEDFGAIAKIMRPRARRRLSAEHRAKLVAAGSKYRFSRARHASV